MNKIIINKIVFLKSFGFFGLKRSFEDEGASLEVIKKTKILARNNKLKISLKIGGCEAITDLINAKNISADKIVSPMIESNFALKKFISSFKKIFKSNVQKFINIESKTAYKNLNKILDKKNLSQLNGIVVGRNDLESSFTKLKKNELNKIVFKIFSYCKKKKPKLIIGMGGKLNPNDSSFIKKAFKKKMLDFIETRNIMIKLNSKNINIIDEIIHASLELENLINNYFNKTSKNKNFQYKKRLLAIKNRLGT